ncbi:hypothetical protein [uncultured Pseudoalteromonas sp.]|tara:strand:+ start:5292 stop:5423 length:132 start_codon:yes stop_codon:yes gene_type:complete
MVNFENLDVWKRSTRLSADIYLIQKRGISTHLSEWYFYHFADT